MKQSIESFVKYNNINYGDIGVLGYKIRGIC